MESDCLLFPDIYKFSNIFSRDLGDPLHFIAKKLSKIRDQTERRRKFRSLLFNFKRNKCLFVLARDGELSPTQIMELTPDQFNAETLEEILAIRRRDLILIGKKQRKEEITEKDALVRGEMLRREKMFERENAEIHLKDINHKKKKERDEYIHPSLDTQKKRGDSISTKINIVEELTEIINRDEEEIERETIKKSKASHLNDRFLRIEKKSGKKAEREKNIFMLDVEDAYNDTCLEEETSFMCARDHFKSLQKQMEKKKHKRSLCVPAIIKSLPKKMGKKKRH
jgi:hypothetical protein